MPRPLVYEDGARAFRLRLSVPARRNRSGRPVSLPPESGRAERGRPACLLEAPYLGPGTRGPCTDGRSQTLRHTVLRWEFRQGLAAAACRTGDTSHLRGLPESCQLLTGVCIISHLSSPTPTTRNAASGVVGDHRDADRRRAVVRESSTGAASCHSSSFLGYGCAQRRLRIPEPVLLGSIAFREVRKELLKTPLVAGLDGRFVDRSNSSEGPVGQTAPSSGGTRKVLGVFQLLRCALRFVVPSDPKRTHWHTAESARVASLQPALPCALLHG